MDVVKNYNAAIDDIKSFHGRAKIVNRICDGPQGVRLLLGGQKSGKTSLLYRIHLELLHCYDNRRRFWPVYLHCHEGFAAKVAEFLAQLLPGKAIANSSKEIGWKDFKGHLNVWLDSLVHEGFTGVLFLLDDCETFLSESWFVDEVASRLEAMMQSTQYRDRIGFIFTGFRDLRHVKRSIGPRLFSLANIERLEPLSQEDVDRLIDERVPPWRVSKRDLDEIFEYGGGHPCLTQRLVSNWISNEGRSVAAVARECTETPLILDEWWNEGAQPGRGFTLAEQKIYVELVRNDVLTPAEAAVRTELSEYECHIAMEALYSSCVLRRVEPGKYKVGARIFSDYIRREKVMPTKKVEPASTGEDSTSDQLVISVHGIRTRGEWQKELANVMGRDFLHISCDYGYFSLLKLLRSGPRERAVNNFRDHYHRSCKIQNRVPSVVAHSFGTYIVAKAMECYPDIRFEKMIFCGSILPPEFQWSKFGELRFSRMLHDYGSMDIWATLAEWGVPDAGPSGSKGFEDAADGRIIQRKHPRFNHSDYFYPGNFEKSWIPFLKGGEPLPTVELLPKRYNWKFSLAVLLVVVTIVALLLIVVR